MAYFYAGLGVALLVPLMALMQTLISVTKLDGEGDSLAKDYDGLIISEVSSFRTALQAKYDEEKKIRDDLLAKYEEDKRQYDIDEAQRIINSPDSSPSPPPSPPPQLTFESKDCNEFSARFQGKYKGDIKDGFITSCNIFKEYAKDNSTKYLAITFELAKDKVNADDGTYTPKDNSFDKAIGVKSSCWVATVTQGCS